MPTAWTAYAQGDVMNPPGPGPVIEQLHTSAFERLRAAFGDSWAALSGRVPYPRPTAGDPFLFSQLWGEPGSPFVPGGLTPFIPIDNALFYGGVAGYDAAGFNGYLRNTLQCFIDHTQVIEGAAARPAYWTMPTIRAAAGLPTTKFYYTDFSHPSATEYVAGRGTLMKRVRYRAIVTTADTRDDQGNAAAAGQRAFIPDGRRYRCVAAGNWVRDESAQADLIDNTRDAPDTVCEFIGLTPTTGNTGATWGTPQIGDVAILHLFEERRAVMDLMRWTMLTPADSGESFLRAPRIDSINGSSNSGSSSGSDTTDAAAEAAAAAAYAGNAPAAGPAYPLATNYLQRQTFGPSELWTASLNRTQSDFGLSHPAGVTLSTLDKKYAYYSLAGPPGGGATVVIFDAQGDPVVNGTYHQWSAGGPVGGSPNSAVLGNVAAAPPNYTDPVAANASTIQGYEVSDVILVCKWNVAGGGLSYCSVTD